MDENVLGIILIIIRISSWICLGIRIRCWLIMGWKLEVNCCIFWHFSLKWRLVYCIKMRQATSKMYTEKH